MNHLPFRIGAASTNDFEGLPDLFFLISNRGDVAFVALPDQSYRIDTTEKPKAQNSENFWDTSASGSLATR